MSTELAKYTLAMEISGMKQTGMPEGVGNKRLSFEVDLDPSDPVAAEIVWYTHLAALADGAGLDDEEGKAAGIMRKIMEKS